MVETNVQTGAQYVQDRWTVGTAINIGHVHLGHQRSPMFASALRDSQSELIKLHTVFGGRGRELDKLQSFLNQTQRPYHFVWGPSGFGKTALLANWVSRLQNQEKQVCFHFVNRLDGVAGEEIVLRNLCEQLVDFFKLSVELPASVDQLHAAYTQLLQHATPDGQSLIIVIDGLDEAKDWTPGRSLFPTRLPNDTHIFFSARAEDEKSYEMWLTQLGIGKDQVDDIRMDRLNKADIQQLLQDSGGNAADLAEDRRFLETISAVSDGDPFYLYHLVKDIQSGDITRDNVANQPNGLHDYLEQWKSDLFDDVDIGREEAYALLIVLIAALGRLKPREFMGISPTLRKGMLLQRELSGKLRRYLVGDQEAGYALCHPRFRDFLCIDPFIEAELDACREALLTYCKRWREHRSDYALNHLATHLAEAGDTDELNRLIDSAWKQARYEQTASHKPFAEDLEITIGAAMKKSPPQPAILIPACLAYTTLMSLAGKVPPGMLGVMARLGRLEAARDHAMLIPNPDARARAYLAISSGLENTHEPNQVREYLWLSLVAAELITEPQACGEALAQLTEAFHRMADVEGLHETFQVIDRIGRELSESLLARFTVFFRRFGAADKAVEFARRTRSAHESADFTLYPDARPALSALVTAGLIDEAEEFLAGKGGRLTGVEDALRKLHEAKRESLTGFDTISLASQVNSLLEINTGFSFSDSGEDSDELHECETLCQQAMNAMQTGDQENARILALQALKQAKAVDVSYGTFGVNSSLSRLCKVTETLVEVRHPQAAEAAFAAIDHYEANRWLLARDLMQVPLAFARVGQIEMAHDLTLKITRIAAGDVMAANALVELAIELIEIGMTSTAEFMVDEVIASIETLGPESQKVMAQASLALSAAHHGLAEQALQVTDSILPGLDKLQALEPKARALGRLALARAIADPASELEAECARVDLESLQDSYKLVASAMVARAFVHSGKKDKAQSLVNDAVNSAGQLDQSDADRGRLVVEIARTMILCGENVWAVKQLQNLLPLTQGSGYLAPKEMLLSDIAAALMDAGEVEQASELALKTLKHAVSCNTDFIIHHLPRITEALIAVGEEPKAKALVEAALDTLETMEFDWLLARTAVVVARSVAQISDISLLERLELLSNKEPGVTDPVAFLGALSRAQKALGQNDRAQDTATYALGLALENPRIKFDSLVQVAEALARTGDKAALKRLIDWALEDLTSEVHADALLATTPSLAVAGCRSTLDRVTQVASELWAYHRVRVLGAATLAWLSLNCRSEAESAAARALEAFDEVGDGSNTPQMIEYLVPALRALRDREGLLQLLNMPRSKAPYAREYIPTLRALLPALAEAGVDEVDPKHVNALRGKESAYGEAQSEIAAVQARRGEIGKARQTATSIDLPDCRAAALMSIGRTLAEGSDHVAATEILLEALSTATGTKPNISLICDIVLAAVKVDKSKVISRLALNELERVSQVSFIGIDTQLYLAAVRILAKADDQDRIAQARAIAVATTHPTAKAHALAALHLALTESGHLSEARELEIEVCTAIDTLKENSARAIPLCHLAKSYALAGRQPEANQRICQACNSARFLDRGQFLSVLDLAIEVLPAEPGHNPIELYQAIEQADSLWEVPP